VCQRSDWLASHQQLCGKATTETFWRPEEEYEEPDVFLDLFKRKSPFSKRPDEPKRQQHTRPDDKTAQFSEPYEEPNLLLRSLEKNTEKCLLDAARYRASNVRVRNFVYQGLRDGSLQFLERVLSPEERETAAQEWLDAVEKLQADLAIHYDSMSKPEEELTEQESQMLHTLEEDRNRLLEVLLRTKLLPSPDPEEEIDRLLDEWMARCDDGRVLETMFPEAEVKQANELLMDIDVQILPKKCTDKGWVRKEGLNKWVFVPPNTDPAEFARFYTPFDLEIARHHRGQTFDLERIMTGDQVLRTLRPTLASQQEAIRRTGEAMASRNQATLVNSLATHLQPELIAAIDDYRARLFGDFEGRTQAACNIGILLSHYAEAVNSWGAATPSTQICVFATLVYECQASGLLFRWVRSDSTAEWTAATGGHLPYASCIYLKIGDNTEPLSSYWTVKRLKYALVQFAQFTPKSAKAAIQLARRAFLKKRKTEPKALYASCAAVVLLIALGTTRIFTSPGTDSPNGTDHSVDYYSKKLEEHLEKAVKEVKSEAKDAAVKDLLEKYPQVLRDYAAKETPPLQVDIMNQCNGIETSACRRDERLIINLLTVDLAAQQANITAINRELGELIPSYRSNTNEYLKTSSFHRMCEIVRGNQEALINTMPELDKELSSEQTTIFKEILDFRAAMTNVQPAIVQGAASKVLKQNEGLRNLLKLQQRSKELPAKNPITVYLLDKWHKALPNDSRLARFMALLTGVAANASFIHEKKKTKESLDREKAAARGFVARVNSAMSYLSAAMHTYHLLHWVIAGTQPWYAVIGSMVAVSGYVLNRFIDGTLDQFRKKEQKKFEESLLENLKRPADKKKDDYSTTMFRWATFDLKNDALLERLAPVYLKWQVMQWRLRGGAEVYKHVKQGAKMSGGAVNLSCFMTKMGFCGTALGAGVQIVGEARFALSIVQGCANFWFSHAVGWFQVGLAFAALAVPAYMGFWQGSHLSKIAFVAVAAFLARDTALGGWLLDKAGVKEKMAAISLPELKGPIEQATIWWTERFVTNVLDPEWVKIITLGFASVASVGISKCMPGKSFAEDPTGAALKQAALAVVNPLGAGALFLRFLYEGNSQDNPALITAARAGFRGALFAFNATIAIYNGLSDLSAAIQATPWFHRASPEAVQAAGEAAGFDGKLDPNQFAGDPSAQAAFTADYFMPKNQTLTDSFGERVWQAFDVLVNENLGHWTVFLDNARRGPTDGVQRPSLLTQEVIAQFNNGTVPDSVIDTMVNNFTGTLQNAGINTR
jgi:hypothetical protein